MTEHVLKFETDDFYGPHMRLEFDRANAGAVVITLACSGSGYSMSVSFDVWEDQVNQLIAHLTEWRDRDRSRRSI